jgi:glycosyltransferase 2 family protein
VTTKRNIWKISWRVGVGLLLLGWILQLIFYNEAYHYRVSAGEDWYGLTRWERLQIAWKYGPIGVWQTLRAMKLIYLGLAIAVMGVIIFLGVLRWHIILKVHGLALPLNRTTEISLIAHFFNSFLLGSVGGDLFKSYYAARETHHKKVEAVVTVAVDRVIGLFSMLVMACVFLLPNLDFVLVADRKVKLVIWIVLGMTAACTVFILVSFWGGVTRTIPKAREWLRKLPKGREIERSIEAFRTFGRDKTFFFRVLPVAMAANLLCVVLVLLLVHGFGLDVPFHMLSLIVMVATCISSLPITPSGLGVRENLYVMFLAAPPISIKPAEGLLISLVGYGTSLFWSMIGGFVYMLVKDKEHLTEIKEETEQESASNAGA